MFEKFNDLHNLTKAFIVVTAIVLGFVLTAVLTLATHGLFLLVLLFLGLVGFAYACFEGVM